MIKKQASGMPVTLALDDQGRGKDHEFYISLGYIARVQGQSGLHSKTF